jgi:hypothetical protein
MLNLVKKHRASVLFSFLYFLLWWLCFRVYQLVDPFGSGTNRLAKTQVLLRETPLDSATYNCPWKKTGSGRYTPTFGMV